VQIRLSGTISRKNGAMHDDYNNHLLKSQVYGEKMQGYAKNSTKREGNAKIQLSDDCGEAINQKEEE